MALYARVSGSSTLSSVKENIFHVSLNDLRANTLKNLLIYYYNFKLYNSLDIFFPSELVAVFISLSNHRFVDNWMCFKADDITGEYNGVFIR